jgi:hypothetical protein
MDINQFIQHIKDTVTKSAQAGIPALQVPQRLQEAEQSWNQQGNTMSDILRTRRVTPEQLSQSMPLLFATTGPTAKVSQLEETLNILNSKYANATGATQPAYRKAIIQVQDLLTRLLHPTAEDLMAEEAGKLTQMGK